MKPVIDRSDCLKLRETAWGWSLICLVLAVSLTASLYQLYKAGIPDLFQFIAVILALSGVLAGFFVFAHQTTIEIHPESKQVRFHYTGLRGRKLKTVAFHDIKTIVVETLRKKNFQRGRVVLHTANESLAFTNAYAGFQEATALAQKVRALVGLQTLEGDSYKSLLSDSVRELVKQKRLIDATMLLQTETGVSTTEARQKVRELENKLEPIQAHSD